MRTMDKPAPLKVELPPSRRMAYFLAAAHAAAVLVLAWMPLPLWSIVAASLVLAVTAWRTISRQALRRGPDAVTALEISDRETLHVRSGDGVWHAGEVLGSSTVGAGLVVLNIRTGQRTRRHVVITGDGINRDDFRRLRVRLRWGPAPAGESA